jgi:hypothetical protein
LLRRARGLRAFGEAILLASKACRGNPASRKEMKMTDHTNVVTATAALSAKEANLAALRAEITAVAATATTEDMALVEEIIGKAKSGKRMSGVYTLSPATSALLHLRYNPHNRDTNVAKVREYARRMGDGQWQWNNQVPGFYVTGEIADSGHRFAAAAIAGFTWETVIIFGIDREAITTIDDGTRRHGYDAAKLNGVDEAKFKESVLKTATTYLTKAGAANVLDLRSITEVNAALKSENARLSHAIEIGRASRNNLVNAVLSETISSVTAYLMLTHGWPEGRIREKLSLFNSGQAQSGEHEPFFVAAAAIDKAHNKSNARHRLTTNHEIGVVLKVMDLSARGAVAVRESALLAEVRKKLIVPIYAEEDDGEGEVKNAA